MNTFDLTPDPKVLIALTHTPMQPLDAICELIDNAIDSFNAAQLQGFPIEYPLVSISLPKLSEIESGCGIIIVKDNGAGMTPEMAEMSIKAGFSGNNPYDTLGLFGMGFNIATGKLGVITKLTTARADANTITSVTIDLEKIPRDKSYSVPFFQTTKTDDFKRGTIIEIRKLWPVGNANHGFIKKLIQYGVPTIRKEIGRRYATILRDRNIRIFVNGEPCPPFEHCVWGDNRFVEKQRHGKIPSVIRINQVVGIQKRCGNCTALIASESNSCPSCGSSSIRTVEERIRGWLGIQRFDDATEFGIDLIRNGRAIRIGEKQAFFEFVDELKKTIKDYPIDQTQGRIIGEIHLNHVPVDFSKQDFQRSSAEWQRAIFFLRGESSLQPTQAGADKNESPLFRLYQGYRKVRIPGKADMYMGYWDPVSRNPKRIDRETEKEYRKKFEQHIPGFYDDAEWWKLVEQADLPQVEELKECPNCQAQNLQSAEQCSICAHVLIGKDCINRDCSKFIPKSTASCPHCGQSQLPSVEEQWICMVCGTRNSPVLESCKNCHDLKGTENTISEGYLKRHSNKSDELSYSGCTVQLVDGSYTTAIDLETFITRAPILANHTSTPSPLIVFKDDSVRIFIDPSHPSFKNYKVRPEFMIAYELALYLYDSNRRLLGGQYSGRHSLASITSSILENRWGDALEDSTTKVKDDIENFFTNFREQASILCKDIASDFYSELTEHQQKNLADNLISEGKDISKLASMKQSGQYLVYVDEGTIIELFKIAPEHFFDGNLWDIPFTTIADLPTAVIDSLRKRIISNFLNCLEDAASFLPNRNPDPIITQRARLSLEFLMQKYR